MTALDQLVLSNLDHLSEEGKEVARERLGKSLRKKSNKKDDTIARQKVANFFLKLKTQQ
jgi:hypothetical protein